MTRKKDIYGNESISSLKGADRVRKRPGVIFGSDNIDGCAHSFFEILSNSTDEAKAGNGDRIEIIRFKDGSIQVKDYGRGVPMDYNKAEGRYNWELVYDELYAGGKFASDGTYDFSLGLNGLGAAATQYASEYFDVTSVRDGYEYSMHFEHGIPVGELKKKKTNEHTGTTQKWKPDIDVFTEIIIPVETFLSVLKEQAVVNAGITYVFYDEESDTTTEFCYPDGILGYVKEMTEDEVNLSEPYLIEGEGKGRDREDKPEYSVKASIAFCFNNKVQHLQYFHNSSYLEHGGSPDKAVKNAFVYVFDRYIKEQKKYTKSENKITFNDITDSLVLVTNTFSTQTSYENQTKKAINNKFIQEFLTDLLKEQIAIWIIEHKTEADKVVDQILINKRSRETSEAQRITVKKKLMGKTDVVNKVKKFVDCRSKDPNERELFICLKGDTKVRLLDGSCQEIETLVGRTDLWGCSTDEIGRMIPAKISSVFMTRETQDMIQLGFGDGSLVECTPEHRFLDKVSLSWMEARYLIVGQRLASIHGGYSDSMEITEIKQIHYEKAIPVYCLTIESEFHSFLLENGLITHNCEGDSALGSLITARNAEFQALMPIRGKILNIEKASLQQIFGSDVIMDLIRVFGCGIEVRGKKLPKDIPQFDINKLNYNKIIFASDEDVDGAHIRTLLLVLFYKLCPQLIEQGYVYYVNTPLFEITDRTGSTAKTYYAFTDAERDKIIKGKDPKKITIQRSKGLGENDAEMMSIFIAPGTRKLTRITTEEAKEMEYWFDLFMGNEVPPRKKYITENGHMYMDNLDIS